ncbi:MULTISPECIES: DUF4239 domain-containing protein [Methylobacterium]|uniref:DUF4239 domain-containing protein n=1 Tax=Methylobacterium longum TaxID=767694 RepID=A0ABT8AJ76_9HYPH|nr:MULTISPECIES: DUF4239 domain-containing protein [Methylobacterium]MCJ2100391.1 DUF4239 domain-containing protein [Methylobacterium sp. E-046]MDN3569536.1 DUF4239 domain-containing protein [Methylobacterium longum]GJE10753.1 hypothetical protein FOHLNKBM_1790 [Methylobacterium longum]
MLFGLWLDQPVWAIFALLAVPFATLSALLCLAAHVRRTRPLIVRLGAGMVPTYFTALATLLALLTGFVANDAWERQRSAARTLQAERANALALYDLSLASVSDMHNIRTALAEYLDLVITQEWPRMGEGGYAPQAGSGLRHLLEAVSDPKITAEAGAPTHAALLSAAMALRADRGERLALSQTASDGTKWLTLLILAALTLVALGLVHTEHRPAQATVLTTFSLAMVATLGLIALHERPFDGPLAMSAEPLIIARAAVTGPAP